MDNTYKVQTILRQHEYKFPHSPMVFNPFPVFLKIAKFGGMVYGVHIPSLEQVKKQSATYTFWHGYDHPANRISNVNATTSKSSDKSASASEPAPKKQKKGTMLAMIIPAVVLSCGWRSTWVPSPSTSAVKGVPRLQSNRRSPKPQPHLRIQLQSLTSVFIAANDTSLRIRPRFAHVEPATNLIQKRLPMVW